MASPLSIRHPWHHPYPSAHLTRLCRACDARASSNEADVSSTSKCHPFQSRSSSNKKDLRPKEWNRRSVLLTAISIPQILSPISLASAVPVVPKPQTLGSDPDTFARIETLLSEAIESWERGLDPTNLTRFKDLYQACRIFDQIVSLDPNRTEWLEARGQVEIDAKKFPEALRDCDEVIKRYPLNYRAYATRALAREGLADWDSAIDDYTMALTVGEQATGKIDPYVLNSRGNAYSSKGLYENALKDYDESARMFQAYRELDGAIYASSNAALVRIQLGDVERGMKELASVARRAPASIDMRAALSALYWSEGKEQKAEDEWRFACENINSGQVFDGCGKYKDMDWLKNIRRWPPIMVKHMDDFLKLRSV